MSILIVDDDAASRDSLAEVLVRRGHAVDVASNGCEALDKIEHAIPQLVILDLRMPVMDGYELREEMLRRPALAGIPVLVVSGTIEAESARDLVAVALMPKPIDVPKICELVDIVEPAPLGRLDRPRILLQ